MPENQTPLVTVVYPEQHDQAAVSLGRAFINDPTFKSILPDITEPVARVEHLADLLRSQEDLPVERAAAAQDEQRLVVGRVVDGVGCYLGQRNRLLKRRKAQRKVQSAGSKRPERSSVLTS